MNNMFQIILVITGIVIIFVVAADHHCLYCVYPGTYGQKLIQGISNNHLTCHDKTLLMTYLYSTMNVYFHLTSYSNVKLCLILANIIGTRNMSVSSTAT